MIHITRAKGGFMVVTLAKNRKTLSTSEILETKRSAFTNVASQAKQFNQIVVGVQDDTGPVPVRCLVHDSGRVKILDAKPGKPYLAKKKAK